ncbi:MAG: YceD family protein [Alcanivoracaceae bacterium]|nr:YceD family protein [Alcanivoracaceae bacterium]
MNSGQLPSFLEPRKLADQEAEIKGQTTVARLPRLAEFRHSQDEIVEVALRFGRDEERRQQVTGTVKTRLQLTCQRCLELVQTAVQANVALVMVYDEEQIKALPEHLDPWLVTDERITLSELLEEELLLALPLVAMHEQCPVVLHKSAEPAAAVESKRDNPFAVLAQLKSRDD